MQHRLTLPRALLFLAPLFALGFVACSGGDDSSSKGSASTTGSGGGASTGSSAGGSGGGDLFDGGLPEAGGGDPGSSLIYASTDDTLYRLDPTSPNLALTEVGKFDCIGPGADQYKAMTDIAVDRNEKIFGITGHLVFSLTIEGTTVKCSNKLNLSGASGMNTPTFYALTFAPTGVLDPNLEVLVAGDSAGQLWAIDAAGTVTQHGSFGVVPADDGNGNAYPAANVGKAWELSGDIVFLANEGAPIGFATVRDCPNPPSTTGCSNTDTLIEIDMSKLGMEGTQNVTKAVRGLIVKNAGCSDSSTSYGSMYGIAAWNDKVYGFSRTGKLVGIDTDKGTACLVNEYVGTNFSGAGVTTLAPVLPPPPK